MHKNPGLTCPVVTGKRTLAMNRPVGSIDGKRQEFFNYHWQPRRRRKTRRPVALRPRLSASLPLSVTATLHRRQTYVNQTPHALEALIHKAFSACDPDS